METKTMLLTLAQTTAILGVILFATKMSIFFAKYFLEKDSSKECLAEILKEEFPAPLVTDEFVNRYIKVLLPVLERRIFIAYSLTTAIIMIAIL